MRLYGALLILTGVLLLSGCPQPLEQDPPSGDGPATMSTQPAGGEQAQPGSAISPDPDAPDSAASDGEPAADATAESQLDDTGEAATDEEPNAAGEPADGDAPDEEATSDDEDGADVPEPDTSEPAEGTDVTLETDDLPLSAPGQGRYDRQPEAEDALDPTALLDGEDDEAVEPEPPAPLDRESLEFSGTWYVVVVNKDGDSYLAQSDDEWVFELDEDGVVTVSQSKEGVTARQSGHWRLNESERLVLQMGPAEREYGIEQPREDVALLIDQDTHAVLFCLRETSGRAPLLQASYNLGGSKLTFRSAGPGDSWRGRLDEPACDLLVRPTGRFIVGSWENERDHGYVLLELSKDGFDGWWWYASSGSFDGQWKSGAE